MSPMSAKGGRVVHVFIPVFFKAPLGGLQAHVRRQAEMLLAAGHMCTVMCRPGPFSRSLRDLPIRVLETSFEDVAESVALAERAGSYHLVHAHPFRSREVGLEVARRQGIPLVVTFHGAYLDELASYAEDVDLVVAVSTGIRDLLVESQAITADRVVVIPNGVDTDLLKPDRQPGPWRPRVVRGLQDYRPSADDKHILFVSRLDPGKEFMLDLLRETWEETERRRAFCLTWWVAGDGVLRGELEALANDLNQRIGRQLITFLGWQDAAALAELYNQSDLVIGPGRCALEGMACGTPVIAVGHRGYIGPVDSETALQGAYGNFGEFGQGHESYTPGAMFRDIDRIIYDEQILSGLGELSLSLVNAYFRQDDLDRALLRSYEFVRTLTPRSMSRRDERALVARPLSGFSDESAPGELSSAWTYSERADRSIEVAADGGLVVRCTLREGERFYLQSGSGSFASPPAPTEQWRMQARRLHVFSVRVRILEGTPQVTMWVIEYDQTQRLRHAALSLRDGNNRLTVRASHNSSCFRLAFRFAGSGAVALGAPELHEQRAASPIASASPVPLLRSRALPSFHDYAGENLVFVVGPPRSGTTWLLNLLRTHPGVVAATVDNLDARIHDHTTLETNILNDDRPFTDMQIKHRFHRLSLANPDKVIVEKTPVHLLFVDRIRAVFPKAALVLIQRDGRDVVTSLVHMGRDKSARRRRWWARAPDTVEKAATLWRTYAEAAANCVARHFPYIVRYEDLLIDAQGELARLQSALGLSDDSVAQQVEASRDGKNIPIPGIFREGKSGGWRRLFSEDDVETFKRVAGELLIQSGYEADGNWHLAQRNDPTAA